VAVFGDAWGPEAIGSGRAAMAYAAHRIAMLALRPIRDALIGCELNAILWPEMLCCSCPFVAGWGISVANYPKGEGRICVVLL